MHLKIFGFILQWFSLLFCFMLQQNVAQRAPRKVQLSSNYEERQKQYKEIGQKWDDGYRRMKAVQAGFGNDLVFDWESIKIWGDYRNLDDFLRDNCQFLTARHCKSYMQLARNPTELHRLFGADIKAGITEQLWALKNKLEIEKQEGFRAYDMYANKHIMDNLRLEQRKQQKEKMMKNQLNQQVKNLKVKFTQDQIDQQHLSIFGFADIFSKLEIELNDIQDIAEQKKVPSIVEKVSAIRDLETKMKEELDVVQSGLKPPSAAISEVGSLLSSPAPSQRGSSVEANSRASNDDNNATEDEIEQKVQSLQADKQDSLFGASGVGSVGIGSTVASVFNALTGRSPQTEIKRPSADSKHGERCQGSCGLIYYKKDLKRGLCPHCR